MVENLDNFAPQAEIPLVEGIKADEKAVDKQMAKSSFISFVREKFAIARDGKYVTEQKALEAFRAWRGELSQEEEEAISKIEEHTGYPSPRIFIKITKTKVQAAYSQLLEILLANNKFPIGIEPTEVPEGVPEKATIVNSDQEAIVDPYGYAGDGEDMAPGDTWYSRLKNKLSGAGKSVIATPSLDKTKMPQIYPAEESARAAEKVIHDQLEESDAEFALRRALLDCCILGSGVIKGPFNSFKTKHIWEETDTDENLYSTEEALTPVISHVMFWNIYPDPGAKKIDECEFVIERHLYSRNQVRKLADFPMFDKNAIKRIISRSPTVYTNENWETIAQDNNNNKYGRYELLEFWGFMDEELAKRLDLDYDEESDVVLGEVLVNGWICDDEVLKLVVNPFEPQRYPYMIFPYEEHPNQLWGIGVPENMEDVQGIMNAHMRMAVENLRLAGNLVFEVNENQLKPGQEMNIWPGKIFRKQGGAPGQSIFALQFPNVATSHFQMFDKARQLADEATGIPSFSHGSTGVTGTGRTAAGMSMLMSAAAMNIKSVVKNIDHYLLMPLGRAMYYWNRQFNFKDFKIKGDIRIVAKGTASLMQREVLTQRLITLLQVAGGNQLTAPFLNAPEILKQISINMGLDPDKVVNDPDKAMLYAEMLQKTQGMTNGNTGSLPQGNSPDSQAAFGQSQGQGSITPNAGLSGETGQQGAGGGGIGVGNVPQTGEPSFTG